MTPPASAHPEYRTGFIKACKFSKQNPMDYIPKYEITAEKLQQQFIEPQITNTGKEAYPQWLQSRAEKLSQGANKYLDSLRGELKLPAIGSDTAAPEHAYEGA